MSEYHQHIGCRLELREKLSGLRMSAASHLESLRMALDPVSDFLNLDEEKIVRLAVALAEDISAAKETAAKIAAINKIIGK